LGTPSRHITILLHAVHDCPGGKNAAIARQVSFAQITLLTDDAGVSNHLTVFSGEEVRWDKEDRTIPNTSGCSRTCHTSLLAVVIVTVVMVTASLTSSRLLASSCCISSS